jgi:hypothetical protein
MRIEFTERYVQVDEEELDKAESMGMPRPKGKVLYRRIYPRLYSIFQPREIPGKDKYCEIEFNDGNSIVVKGSFMEVCQQIDDREAQADGDLEIEE